MIDLRSYTAETLDIIKVLISANRRVQPFRKLLLYPTELRGPSAPVIFYLKPELHELSTINNHVSSIFTKHLGETSGRGLRQR